MAVFRLKNSLRPQPNGATTYKSGDVYLVFYEDTGIIESYKIDNTKTPKLTSPSKAEAIKLREAYDKTQIDNKFSEKVTKEINKSLVDNPQISKLEDLKTQAEITNDINTIGSLSSGKVIKLTGTVLPRGASIPAYVTDTGVADLLGASDAIVQYTNTGTTPSSIPVGIGKQRKAFYDKVTDTWTGGLEQELPMIPLEDVDGASLEKSVSQRLVTDNKIDRLKNDSKTYSLIDNKIKGNIDISTKKWINASSEFYHAQVAIKPGDDIIINLDLAISSFTVYAVLSSSAIPVNTTNAPVLGNVNQITNSVRFTAPSGAKVLYIFIGEPSNNYLRTPHSVYINGINIIKENIERELSIKKIGDDTRSGRLFNLKEIARKGNIFTTGTDPRPWSWRNVSSSTENHVLIPVFAGDVVGLAPRVKGTGAFYALLKYDTKNLVERGYVPFVNDADGRVTITSYTEITIAQDCYLYLYLGNNVVYGGTTFPDLSINGVNVINTAYNAAEINTQDMLPVDYYYFTGAQSRNKRINYFHLALPVIEGDVIQFDGGSLYAFFSTYITPVNGATPDYSTGYNSTYNITSAPVTIPDDCNYLYVYLGAKVDGDYDMRPNSISKNGTPLVINLETEAKTGNIYLGSWNNTVLKVFKATALIPIIRKPYIEIELYAGVSYDVDTVNFYNKDKVKVGYCRPLPANDVIRQVFNFIDFTSNSGKITFIAGYSFEDIEYLQVFNLNIITTYTYFKTNYKLLDIQEFFDNKLQQLSEDISKNNANNRANLLVFEDHFDSLNDLWQPTIDVTLESYNTVWVDDPSILFVKDSILHLVCKKATGYSKDFIAPFIKSTNKLEFPEGRYEAKIRMETSENFAGAFWSIGTYPEWPKCFELDTFETFANRWDEAFTNVHYSKDDVDSQTGINKVENLDVTKWHIYAVEWNQSLIKFFVDEILVNEISVSSLDADSYISNMDLRFNIKAGYELDVADTEDSATLLVDYVRVYTTVENYGKYPLKDFTVPSTLNVLVNEVVFIHPLFIPSNATETAFKLSSSNPSIARIREEWGITDKGVIGVSAGTATVTVTSADGSIIKTIIVTVS